MNRFISKIVVLTFSLILASTLTFAAEMNDPSKLEPPSASTVEPFCRAGFLDINTATVEQLTALPGMVEAYAEMIIAGRPYTNRDELKSNKIIPAGTYEKIKDYIVAEPLNK